MSKQHLTLVPSISGHLPLLGQRGVCVCCMGNTVALQCGGNIYDHGWLAKTTSPHTLSVAVCIESRAMQNHLYSPLPLYTLHQRALLVTT